MAVYEKHMKAMDHVLLATAISNKEARQVGRRLGDAGLRWITYQSATVTTIYVHTSDLSTAKELRYPKNTFHRRAVAVALTPVVRFSEFIAPTRFPAEDEEFPNTHDVRKDY